MQLRNLRSAGEVDVRDAPAAREQRPHVTPRLRALQLTERPAHLRNLKVFPGVGADDEKQPARGTALVQLSGRMEIARADPQRRGATQCLAPGRAHLLQ